tara:strand:- start:179 stop:427 length:249 start_codon:yes stop_codon:yes gene_type:complete
MNIKINEEMMYPNIWGMKVVPQTYLKSGFIVITYGWKVLINGKKFPKARGEIYSKSYYQYRGGKDAMVKKAIKDFREDWLKN